MVCDRLASGEGARSIAGALNRQQIPSPRAQQGRPSGWSASTVRAVLERPLRAALTQRAEAWKADLRDEPKVARLLLRRLVGPLTLWDEADAGLRWDAEPKADELLDGLVHLDTSPTSNARFFTRELRRSLRKAA
jgi:Recombinase